MKEYFLGADVSKGYTDFILLDKDKEVKVRNFQLDDTFGGHSKLHQFLSNFFEEHEDSVIYAGFESTGGYEDNWIYFLRKLQKDYPIKVARLNPNNVCNTRKAELAGNVTDHISAKAIAYHLINVLPTIKFNAKSPYSSLKRTWTHLRMLKKQKVQLLNQFESLLYISHTQLISYCSSRVPEWLLQLVIEYPTADLLSRGHIKKISQIPYITENKARELKEEAKKSVASATDAISAELLQDLAKTILSYKQKIKKWEDRLVEECEIDEVKILTTIPNIAEYTAVGLMINMGSVERFDHVKKLASYWGIHPEIKESGDGRGKPGLSKKGRSIPRELLFNAVFASLSDEGNYIQKLYEEFVEDKGKSKMSAIGILMHKLTRIIYGMLKNSTVYNPQIDKENRQESKSKKQRDNDSYSRKRRIHNFDSNAPVSRREKKKRKERIETQDADASIAGSSIPLFSENNIENIMQNLNLEINNIFEN